MNREIKFRVWDKTRNRFEPEGRNKNEFISISLGFGSEVCAAKEDFILQQFTGLKDKNGREIYEGDIVKTIYPDENSIGAVEFDTNLGAVRIKCGKTSIPIKTYRFENGEPIGLIDVCEEVIGNIFENPKYER